MYCSKCGQELNANDRFCPNCGAAIEAKNTREFSPMFKVEAEKRSEQILQAQKDFHNDINDVVTERPPRESIKWDWDLTGLPTGAVKKTEPVNFNWQTGANTAGKASVNDFMFERIEPKKNMMFTDRAAVEKATAELEIGQLQAKARGLSEEYSKLADIPEKEVHTGGFSEIMTLARAMENEKPLTIEELEKSIFEEMGHKDTANVKEPTESERIAIDDYFDRTIIAKHFDFSNGEKSEKAETDENASKFYTYNQKISAFDELLHKTKQEIGKAENEAEKYETETFGTDKSEDELSQTQSLLDRLFGTPIIKEKKSKHSKSKRSTGKAEEYAEYSEEEPAEEFAEYSEDDTAEEYAEYSEEESSGLSFTSEHNQLNAEGNSDKTRTYVDLDALFGSNAYEPPEKKKHHVAGKIIIILLIVLLIGEVGLAAFKLIAPESRVSQWTDDMIVKFIDIFMGNSDEEPKPDINEADEQAAYFAGLLNSAGSKASTVGEFLYNGDLKYDSITSPAYKEITGAGKFTDADWYQDENGQTVTYCSKLFEVFVKYYDNWKSTNEDATIIGINKVEVGEIRSTEDGFYILSKITFANGDGTTSDEVRTTFVKKVNSTHALVVNSDKKEEV